MFVVCDIMSRDASMQILESEKLAKFFQNIAKVDTMLKQSQSQPRDKPAETGFTLKSLLKIITFKGVM